MVYCAEIRRTYCSPSSLITSGREPSACMTEDNMRALVLGVATLALSAGAASAQAVYPSGYGYDDYATPVADLAAPAYGYAAPAYGYAAPAAPTVVIVTPAPAYAAAPVVSGYATQPIYDYAPGYGHDYTPGYWNRGYWGRWRAGYGWR